MGSTSTKEDQKMEVDQNLDRIEVDQNHDGALTVFERNNHKAYLEQIKMYLMGLSMNGDMCFKPNVHMRKYFINNK
jgi:hypothetical protein